MISHLIATAVVALGASVPAFAAETASFADFEKEVREMAERLPEGEDERGAPCSFRVSRVRGGLYLEIDAAKEGRIALQVSERAEIAREREIDPAESDGSFADTYSVPNVGSVTLVSASDAYHFARLKDADGNVTHCGQYY